MTLSEMRQTLAAGNIQLTKSLGQNFLHDANQLHRIVASAEISTADRVLEVGPGLGQLTELLLARSREVLAIEKDRRLVEFLAKRFALQQIGDALGRVVTQETKLPDGIQSSLLKLVHDDALDYLHRERSDWSGWKLVANLPYSVASRILVEQALAVQGPRLMVATLQMEVVQRLLANAGEEHYGILTLLVQLTYQPAGWFKIPASCFFPQPEIDSGCIKLIRRPCPLLDPAQMATFAKVVKSSFSQRRKMMFKLLKAEWPSATLEQAFEAAGLSFEVRAEAVSLDQFVKFTQQL